MAANTTLFACTCVRIRIVKVIGLTVWRQAAAVVDILKHLVYAASLYLFWTV